MTMNTVKMKKILEEKLTHPDYRTSYNRDQDTYRIEWKESKQGVTITLTYVVAKYNERGEKAVDDLVEHITESLKIMNQTYELKGISIQIIPDIRSTSFHLKTTTSAVLFYKENKAYSRIFYALDLGKTYRLIDESSSEKEDWSKKHVDEIATFNLRSLSTDY